MRARVETGVPRVALGFSRRRDSDLLSGLFEEYDVVEMGDAVPEGTDLCVVDREAFARVGEALAGWKERERPVYAPVFLLTQGGEVDAWQRYADAVGDRLDAIHPIPAPSRALRSRVRSLLETREYSLSAHERREQLELYERAMDGATVGLTIADASDPDLPLTYVNDGFCSITGYDREEALGCNCRFLQGEETDPGVVERIRDAIESEEPVSLDIRNYRKSGEIFWNSLDVAPIADDDGEVSHFLGVQRDVTALREDRAKLSVFDRVLRHNLRNKLNVVLGHAEWLAANADPEDDEGTASRADRIGEAATDLLELSEAARRFNRAADSARRDVLDVDLAETLAGVEVELARTFPSATVDVRVPDGTRVRSPPTLHLCIEQLVRSAVERSGRDDLVVTVSLADPPSSEHVELRVSDDGTGVSQTQRDVLKHGLERPVEHADGLRLWLVQWAVERSGGQLRIEDNELAGSTVVVVFPRTPVDT